MKRLTTYSAILCVVGFVEASAQKFPSCVATESQQRTRAAMKTYIQNMIEDKTVEIVDVRISIPYAEDAYPGPFAGVLKCSVTGVAVIRRQDRSVVQIPLLKTMIYYTYDQQGNLIVEANPDSSKFN